MSWRRGMPENVSDGLFDLPGAPQTAAHDLSVSSGAPLAVRMRPASLDDVVGQDHLLAVRVAAAPAGRGLRRGIGDSLRPPGKR